MLAAIAKSALLAAAAQAVALTADQDAVVSLTADLDLPLSVSLGTATFQKKGCAVLDGDTEDDYIDEIERDLDEVVDEQPLQTERETF